MLVFIPNFSATYKKSNVAKRAHDHHRGEPGEQSEEQADAGNKFQWFAKVGQEWFSHTFECVPGFIFMHLDFVKDLTTVIDEKTTDDDS